MWEEKLQEEKVVVMVVEWQAWRNSGCKRRRGNG